MFTAFPLFPAIVDAHERVLWLFAEVMPRVLAKVLRLDFSAVSRNHTEVEHLPQG